MDQLSIFKVFMSPNVPEILTPVLTSGSITQGKQVELFESQLQSFFNYPYILTLNSATSGLTLALRMLDLSPGDEVISTPLTCTATNWPILANGLGIKWADVDTNTCNISIESIKKALTLKTKAIMVVHWGGYPVDLDGLKEVQEYSLYKFGFKPQIIEDCAHAFGAKYNDSFVGTTGNTAVFSLQAIKHLTCGDGGLIFLPSKEEYERAKLLRWYGIDREKRSGGDFRLELDIPEWGYKYHMNDISASIGIANLPFIANNLQILRDNAKMYRDRLEGVEGVKLLSEDIRHESAYWLFTLKIVDKYGFIQFAKEKGVMASQVHNRNDKHSCVKSFYNGPSALPGVNKLEKSIVCIPVGWWLSIEDKERIISTVIEWAKQQTLVFHLLKIGKCEYLDEFLALMRQLNGHNYSLSVDEFNLKLEKINRSGGIIVGILNNKIVCSGRLLIEEKLSKSVVHIEDIVVDSAYRGRGIGTRLVKRLVSDARQLDCYKIILDAKPELKSFYEMCGFTQGAIQMSIRL